MSKKNGDEAVDLLPTVLTVTEIGVSLAKATAEKAVEDPNEEDLEGILTKNTLKASKTHGVGTAKGE